MATLTVEQCVSWVRNGMDEIMMFSYNSIECWCDVNMTQYNTINPSIKDGLLQKRITSFTVIARWNGTVKKFANNWRPHIYINGTTVYYTPPWRINVCIWLDNSQPMPSCIICPTNVTQDNGLLKYKDFHPITYRRYMDMFCYWKWHLSNWLIITSWSFLDHKDALSETYLPVPELLLILTCKDHVSNKLVKPEVYYNLQDHGISLMQVWFPSIRL